MKWSTIAADERPSSVAEAVLAAALNKDLYPNIYVILSILLTLPVTTASAPT